MSRVTLTSNFKKSFRRRQGGLCRPGSGSGHGPLCPLQALEGLILEKPVDKADAHSMLSRWGPLAQILDTCTPQRGGARHEGRGLGPVGDGVASLVSLVGQSRGQTQHLELRLHYFHTDGTGVEIHTTLIFILIHTHPAEQGSPLPTPSLFHFPTAQQV